MAGKYSTFTSSYPLLPSPLFLLGLRLDLGRIDKDLTAQLCKLRERERERENDIIFDLRVCVGFIYS